MLSGFFGCVPKAGESDPRFRAASTYFERGADRGVQSGAEPSEETKGFNFSLTRAAPSLHNPTREMAYDSWYSWQVDLEHLR